MSAEPKPEKPRTTPASSAAPTAAANSAERTSRLVPATCSTAGHRRTPAGSADEARGQGGAAGAAAGGEAAAPGLGRLADREVPRGPLDVGGAGGGEVVVEDARVHESMVSCDALAHIGRMERLSGRDPLAGTGHPSGGMRLVAGESQRIPGRAGGAVPMT